MELENILLEFAALLLDDLVYLLVLQINLSL